MPAWRKFKPLGRAGPKTQVRYKGVTYQELKEWYPDCPPEEDIIAACVEDRSYDSSMWVLYKNNGGFSTMTGYGESGHSFYGNDWTPLTLEQLKDPLTRVSVYANEQFYEEVINSL